VISLFDLEEVMGRFVTVSMLLIAGLAACVAPAAPAPTTTPPPEPKTLTVFAAASLTDAFTEIGKEFEAAHSGVTVAFNFGGSQNLRTQLEQGAAADVFASANQKEIDGAVTAGLVVSGTAQVFLTNQLVAILPKDNPGRVEKLEDLARPGLKLVLAAEDVPVGSYSRQVLDKLEAQYGAGFKSQVLANVVSNEDNVKQVVTKVQLGEADAGIVYGSDAVAAPELKTIVIPNEFNVTAQYPLAVLAHAPHPDLARAFADYVLSSEGQAVLKKWGFTPIQ
jgi:molybdate transport system substrate-binding protein